MWTFIWYCVAIQVVRSLKVILLARFVWKVVHSWKKNRFKFEITLFLIQNFELCLLVASRLHTGERPFVCVVCGKGFTSKEKLTRHSLIHTGERPFVCQHCGKVLSREDKLKNHMRIHTNNFPFRCETCGKGFLRNEGLVVHTRIHTGERPFQCVVCGKAYTRKDKLTRHAFVHTGERPHVCQHCGKSFIWKDKMQRHELIHKIEKPYTCVPCNLEFPRQEDFNGHMERKHPERLPYTLVQQPPTTTPSPSYIPQRLTITPPICSTPQSLPHSSQQSLGVSSAAITAVHANDHTTGAALLSQGTIITPGTSLALASKTLASITSRLPTTSLLSLHHWQQSSATQTTAALHPTTAIIQSTVAQPVTNIPQVEASTSHDQQQHSANSVVIPQTSTLVLSPSNNNATLTIPTNPYWSS